MRTTLRRHPQPVPPICQPEVAADAIVFASEHPRREIWVGHNTAALIAANAVAPWVGDRYLARTNIEAQQTDEPIPADRPDHLFAPLPGDRGAHGRFDAQAKPRSLQLALTKRKRPLLAAFAAAAATGGTAALARRARSR